MGTGSIQGRKSWMQKIEGQGRGVGIGQNSTKVLWKSHMKPTVLYSLTHNESQWNYTIQGENVSPRFHTLAIKQTKKTVPG